MSHAMRLLMACFGPRSMTNIYLLASYLSSLLDSYSFESFQYLQHHDGKEGGESMILEMTVAVKGLDCSSAD